MNFQDFLISKNIDANQFKASDSLLYHEWENQFEKIHPESFIAQKKFSINTIRRKYILERKQI